MPSDSNLIDDDDLSDEEVYTFAPGEPESVGAVTFPNGIVIGPGEMVDVDGTRHPAPESCESAERPGWTAYAWTAHPPE